MLCTEVLGQMISGSVEEGSWKAVKHARYSPSLSHIFFADDLILFGEASLSQARIMADILKLFCLVSRQKINTQKSLLFTSRNTPNHTRSLLSHTFDILFTEDLGLYLELRVLHGRLF